MWELVKKDILLEWRAREILPALLLMGALSLVILSFAFDPGLPSRREEAPAAFWVALLFATMYGIGRTFVAEQHNDVWQGLLLSPLDRGTIYLAKTIATLLHLLLGNAILAALFVLFFDVPLQVECWSWLLSTFLASLGLAALGTLFSAIAIRTRAREVMLPLLLVPLVVPLFLAGVEITKRSLAAQPLGASAAWLHLMAGFDVAAVVVGWVLFEYVVEDS